MSSSDIKDYFGFRNVLVDNDVYVMFMTRLHGNSMLLTVIRMNMHLYFVCEFLKYASTL